MAHFAELDDTGVVTRVVVLTNDVLVGESGEEEEQRGIDYLNEKVYPARWMQTSYSGRIRHRYACIGMSYVESADAFVMPQPYPSWSLDLSHPDDWRPPVARPDDESKHYEWDEEKQEWIGFDKPVKPPVVTLGE